MVKQEMEQTILYNHLVKELELFFKEVGFEKAVIGISGGIDSAVVAALSVAALGKENVTGIFMPASHTSQESSKLAKDLAQSLNITLKTMNIRHMEQYFVEECASSFREDWNPIPNVAEENIQARLRMVTLYAYANKNNCLVVNTSNMTEALLGYGTMYGDVTGSISPLGRVGKLMVYRLANYINRKKLIIPQEIIDRQPTAELSDGQTDEGSLGSTYAILDPLTAYVFYEMAYSNASFITSSGSFNPDMTEIDDKYGKIFPSVVAMEAVVRMKKNAFKMLQCPPPIVLPENLKWWEMYPEFHAEFKAK